MTKLKDDKADEQNFRLVGLAFLVTGVALMVGEATRATGIPFLILGMTFVAIGSRDS